MTCSPSLNLRANALERFGGKGRRSGFLLGGFGLIFSGVSLLIVLERVDGGGFNDSCLELFTTYQYMG